MAIKIDSRKTDALIKHLVWRFSNHSLSGLWGYLKHWLEGVKEKLFKDRGGSFGRRTWPDISPTLYGKIRRGSDGSDQGVYSSSSHPLFASGSYRQSFKFSETPRSLTFYSAHDKADRIPYAGWNRRDGKYDPRYALPDVRSNEFKAELSRRVSAKINEWIKEVV